MNCYFSSAYGNIQNTKSKFENKIPLSMFFNPSIQSKSLTLDNKISLLKKYQTPFISVLEGKEKYENMHMWSVKKCSFLYLSSATLTCFIHKVKKTIKLKSGLFSKISKAVSYLNSVFIENEITVRFFYRGGNMKITYH